MQHREPVHSITQSTHRPSKSRTEQTTKNRSTQWTCSRDKNSSSSHPVHCLHQRNLVATLWYSYSKPPPIALNRFHSSCSSRTLAFLSFPYSPLLGQTDVCSCTVRLTVNLVVATTDALHFVWLLQGELLVLLHWNFGQLCMPTEIGPIDYGVCYLS